MKQNMNSAVDFTRKFVDKLLKKYFFYGTSLQLRLAVASSHSHIYGEIEQQKELSRWMHFKGVNWWENPPPR